MMCEYTDYAIAIMSMDRTVVNVKEVRIYCTNKLIPYPVVNILHCVTVLKKTVLALFM